MIKANTRFSYSCPVFVITSIAIACSTNGRDDADTRSSALRAENGIFQNGLTTNGLIENGIFQNGIFQNGIFQNGIFQNGIFQNGIFQNGIFQNGIFQNGIFQNGIFQNGIFQNGQWQNGIFQNGLWQQGVTGDAAYLGDTLRRSGYARQLLQYIYSCAMPAGTYDTTLDPNDLLPLVCAADADCDLGYSCMGNKCVIPLQGAGANNSGLGINDDLTTWWAQPVPGGPIDPTLDKWGKCDQTCQRWVSACVLARTNAYGVHVPISMRAPAGAPAAIRAALEVTPSEANTFQLPEGVFYGNIFATTPTTPTGPIASTPQYFACAGPGSNIPVVTKRFCSSQGDQAVIQVPGVCVSNTSQNGICVDLNGVPASTLNEIVSCPSNLLPSATHYSEFISVFLQQPTAVCGNAVCEEGEAATCESDCHPGTWTKNYDPNFETLQTQIPPLGDSFPNFADYSMAALGPDDTIVVVGDSTALVDLDGMLLPMSGSGGDSGILVKYNADGTYAWPGIAVRFNNVVTVNGNARVTGITVAPITGNITVIGTTGTTLWFKTFDPNGSVITFDSYALGATVSPGRNVSVDSSGNIYIAGYLNGNATFPTTPPTVLSGAEGHSAFLMKITPSVGVVYAQLIPGNRYVGSLTNDSHDNTLLTTWQVPSTGTIGPTLIKKCADPTATTCADGSTAWGQTFGGLGAFTAASADASGNVYAGGIFGTNVNFGGGQRPTVGFPPFLVKYNRNGTYQWDQQGTITCAPSGCDFGSYVYPTNISFDPNGNVVMATWGTPSIGGSLSFGLGTAFPTYATSNIFLSAYLPTGSLRWSKQIAGVLGINARGIALDSVGRVVVSGTFGGSMVVDDVMFATGLTEDPNTVNPFLASFGGPPPGDNQAPILGYTIDQSGNSLYTLPQDIYVQATKPAGADVFYMLPTVIDDGNAGTSIICLPPPNSTFPIGITTVTCTGSDPLGHHDSASFTVTVVDKIGPIFSPVHDISVEAPNAGGATVPYSPPTATDQISGGAAVTCTPSSGSLFSVGHHTVTCTASDARGNQSSVTFNVDVTQAGIGAHCLSTADCSTGTCVDGVCCNTTATSCGQCRACNTASALGTCAPTSGGSCDDGDACTQTDTCQAGACMGSNLVTCSASDQCHVAGTCNPATGVCSNPAAPNGATCNDGNACTQTDTCQTGTCSGANPVTCAASDQCHVAGTCNPATGACSNPAAPSGTACSDGNACTQSDTCQAGVCSGSNPVTCPASDQCHVVGTCDPSTGACSNPAAPNGTTCSDGNVCTAGDVCMVGACVGGGGIGCDDLNPCTVDSCNAVGGCIHSPGNAGVTCRAAANACDSAEVCTGSSAACPASSDKQPPALGPGTNQTIVGNCSGSGVVFAVPAPANSSCESGTNVTCAWTLGSSHGTCAKSGTGASLPGNRYGAYSISCTARDAAGNASSAVAFTVTVLQPLTIRIQPPLSGDNNTVDNVVKLNSTVPNKVRLYACGSDVTRTASVTVKLGTTFMSSGGSSTASIIATCTDAADSGGVMILDGANYRYNLSTKGLSVTAGVPAFYQENITAAYRSAPSVVVGTDTIQIDIK